LNRSTGLGETGVSSGRLGCGYESARTGLGGPAGPFSKIQHVGRVMITTAGCVFVPASAKGSGRGPAGGGSAPERSGDSSGCWAGLGAGGAAVPDVASLLDPPGRSMVTNQGVPSASTSRSRRNRTWGVRTDGWVLVGRKPAPGSENQRLPSSRPPRPDGPGRTGIGRKKKGPIGTQKEVEGWVGGSGRPLRGRRNPPVRRSCENRN